MHLVDGVRFRCTGLFYDWRPDRADFAKRYEDDQHISLLELVYPVLQGYDSVMLKCDLEIGGSDQLFNMLVGRDLQEREGEALPVLDERRPSGVPTDPEGEPGLAEALRLGGRRIRSRVDRSRRDRPAADQADGAEQRDPEPVAGDLVFGSVVERHR